MFKIIYNTISQLVGKFISAGTTLLITIIVANKFGTNGYGEYTKILTYTALFYLISDFGLNAIAVREMTEKKEESTKLFQNLFGLRIVFSLILMFIAISLISFFSYNPISDQGFSPLVKLGIIIASLTILTQAVFTTTNTLFQLNLRYDKSIIASSIGSITTLLLIFLLTNLNSSLLFVIFSYVIGGMVTILISIILAKKYVQKISPLFETTQWINLFLKTLPIGLMLLFNLIYFRLDVFILSFLKPSEDVGIYGYAYKYFEFALTIPVFFMNSYYPSMLKDSLEDKIRFNNNLKKTTAFLLITSVLIATIGILASPLISVILNKQNFQPSILPMRILLLSLPVYFLSSLYMWVLITLKKEKILALVYFVSMLINGILNLVFIPQFSYIASAAITGIVEALILLVTYSLSRKYINAQIKGENEKN